MPQSAERRQDLQTLENDYDRLGPEVLEAAVRAGRDLHACGRFRLFDLRRYCAGLRSTCVAAGLDAVKKRESARLAAAQNDRRRAWDDRVKDHAQKLRALGRAVTLDEAEADLRKGGVGDGTAG